MIEPLLSDEALLADIASSEAGPGRLHCWWLGQSGVLIAWAGGRVLIDPYLSDALTRKYAGTERPHVRMSRRVVDPARLREIDLVLSTHGHTDHLDAETLGAVRAAAGDEPPALLAPRAIGDLASQRWGGDAIGIDAGETAHVRGVFVAAVQAAHDSLERDARGRCPCLAYVLRLGPFTIYHAGDGVVHDALPGAVLAAAPAGIDVAFVPINGRLGNMDGADAARLARTLGARLAVPCHYHLFEFNSAEPSAAFEPECRRLGQPFRTLRLGERLSLRRDDP